MSNGREIDQIIFVTNRDGEGDGTNENPYSFEQFEKIDRSKAIVIVTNLAKEKGGKEISSTEYKNLQKLPEVINEIESIDLISTGDEKALITIKGCRGISVTVDPNTTTDADFASRLTTKQVYLVNPKIAAVASVIPAPLIKQERYHCLY